MPRYRVHGLRKDTMNPSHRTFYACDEGVAFDLADEDGMYVEKVDLIEPEPATISQIAFAGRLGIDLPDDCDVDEASSLISNALEKDVVASDELFKIANTYKLYTTRFSGEKDIYDRLLPWLSRPGSEQKLTEWFVYNLYRDKIKHRNDISLEDPDDHKVWSIARELHKDERVIKSIKRYEGIDLLGFGFVDLPDERMTSGGSRNTIAYKAANKLIKESISYWAIRSPQKSSPQNRSKSKSHHGDDLPPFPEMLLELAIQLPIAGLMFWVLYKILL